MSVFQRILRQKNFWPLFSAQSLGAFNDNFFRQALIAFLAFESLDLTVTEKTILSSLATGLMMLPYFLFSSLSGELSDRYRKSGVMKITKAMEVLFMLLAAAFFMNGYIYPLLTILFLMGLQSTFFGPLKYGLLPEVLAEKDLVAGNGLVEASTFLAIVLGTMAGSWLATVEGGTIYYLPAGLVGVALIGFLVSLKQPVSEAIQPDLKIQVNLFRSTRDIMGSIMKRRELWLSVLAISWFWAMGAVLLTQLPILCSSLMGATPAVNTFLVTMFALGVAIGSVAVQWLLKGRVSASLVPISAALLTLFMFGLAYSVANLPELEARSIGLSVALSQWVYLRLALCCFMVSVTGGLFVVPLNALLQHRSEAGERSRVIAANNIVNSLFIVAGSLGVMVATKLGLNLSAIFLLVAFTALLVTLMTMYFLPDTVLRQLVMVLVKFIYRPKVDGLEHLENLDGPVLVIPNHTSFLDVALLVAYFPRTLSFAVDSYWAKAWWIQPLLRFFKSLPVNPVDPMATRGLIEALDNGEMVVVFPEGRLTTTGGIMKVYEGPGLIAIKSGAPLLPVIFEGPQYTFFGRLRKLMINRPRRVDIRMTILPPRHLDTELRPNESRRDLRRRICDDIYDILVQGRFSIRNYKQNLWTVLKAMSRRCGSGRVIVEDYTRARLSYGGLIRRARILGRRISRISSRGENVGVLLPNSNVLTAVLFGLWAGGRVPVMLNYSQGRHPLNSALATAGVKIVITSRKFLAALDLSEDSELSSRLVVLEDLSLGVWDKLAGLWWRGDPAPSDSPATIIFTSGSEGLPKGVCLSHENILANIYQAASVIEISEDDILFNAMPAFHTFGLNVGMVLPLVLGLKSFNYPTPLHVKLIPELIYDSRATIVITSDSFASSWGKNAHAYDFLYVRFMILGAEKVKEKTMELYFHKLNVRLFEGYGVTEASPILAVGSRMRVKDGSVGHLLPGIETRLMQVEGLGGEGGRLLVKGPNIMMGYIRAEHPGVIEKLDDGWYDTGDIVEIDQDGFIWIKGRFKRFAKISGEMVSLASIEDVAASIWSGPQVIMSLPDENKGEKLALVTTDHAPDLDALRSAIKKAGFSEISCPRQFIHVDKIALTPLGKVNMPEVAAEVQKVLGNVGALN